LIQAHVFPALFRTTPTGRRAETILESGAASCFYHEGKKAVVPCDGCGRFLCALCEVEMNERHLCPTCVGNARAGGGVVNLEARRTTYDTGALAVLLTSLVLILFWPIWLVTAPAAIGLGVFSFFRPRSLSGRGRLAAWAAIVVGLLQLGACLWAFRNLIDS
jgi:hypothetical protein